MKHLLLVVSAAFCMTACGGSTSISTTGDNSQCVGNVTRPSPTSWLLTEPEVHFDFWGDWSSFPKAKQPYSYQLDWFYLLNYGHVLQRLSEYGIHEGTLDTTYYTNTGSTTYVNDSGVNDAGQTLLDDSSFTATLNAEIQLGLLPYPNDNTLYVVMLPPNVYSGEMINNGWGGYHGHYSYGSQKYAYAIVSYSGNDVIISHELYEAVTDPGLDSYFDRPNGGEIGDLCAPYTEGINGISVQKVWSQSLCSCF